MNKPWNDKVPYAPATDLAVVIGRFEILHEGHGNLFKEAAKASKNILVLVGSSYIARNSKDPFTFDERKDVIEHYFKNDIDLEHINSYRVWPIIDDLYSNTRWIAEVQAAITNRLNEIGLGADGRVTLIGYHKDSTSFYLDLFPGYNQFEIKPITKVSSTDLRYDYFVKDEIAHNKRILSGTVAAWLAKWKEANAEVFANIKGEFEFLDAYKKQFEGSRYPPIFVTTDAIVVCKGHILLVKRRSHPGKGLYALPGGFLQQNETIENGMLRELHEETKIHVDKEILRLCIQGKQVFDAPNRSLRGRTITHASLIVLNKETLPTVKGSDDAEKATWIPIAQFYNMSEEMFEDHYSVGIFMINRVR